MDLNLLIDLEQRYEPLLNSEQRVLNPDLHLGNTMLGRTRDDDMAIDWAYLGVGTPWINLVRNVSNTVAWGCYPSDVDTCLERAPLTRDVAPQDIDAVISAQVCAWYCDGFTLMPGSRELQAWQQYEYWATGNRLVGWLAERIDRHRTRPPRSRPLASSTFSAGPAPITPARPPSSGPTKPRRLGYGG